MNFDTKIFRKVIRAYQFS